MSHCEPESKDFRYLCYTGQVKASLIFILFFGPLALHAEDGEEPRPLYGKHHGYLFDVADERNKRDLEMVMLPKPKEDPNKGKDVIFNDKLAREFQQQYEYRFGTTTAEQVVNSPSRADGYTYYTGENLTIKGYQHYQQQFAEYMSRRLVEYHVDDWAKRDPDFRPVYEFKDRVSNVNVNVQKFKFKWKYNFSGPNMDLKVENPYAIDFKVRLEMDGLISSPKETIWSLAYPLTNRISMQGLYKEKDGVRQLTFTRRMTKHLNIFTSGLSDISATGPGVKQNLFLVGFTWSE